MWVGTGSGDGRRQEQEHLWQQFFRDPTMWWDNRGDKESSRSPDFRRKGSGEVLWLNTMFKPALVDEQLVSLDTQMGHGASASKLSSPDNLEPGRRAGCGMGSRCSSVRSLTLPHPMGRVRALESLAQTHSGGFSVYVLHCAIQVRRIWLWGDEFMISLSNLGTSRMHTWGTISCACMQIKDSVERHLVCIGQMEQEGLVVADEVRLACLLKACASAAAVNKGRQLHSQIVERGVLNNILVGTCLVDMDGKCGELEVARERTWKGQSHIMCTSQDLHSLHFEFD